MSRTEKIEALDRSIGDCHLIKDTWERHRQLEHLAGARFELQWGQKLMLICMAIGLILGLLTMTVVGVVFGVAAGYVLGGVITWCCAKEAGARAVEKTVYGS